MLTAAVTLTVRNPKINKSIPTSVESRHKVTVIPRDVINLTGRFNI